jgi:cytochrome c553
MRQLGVSVLSVLAAIALAAQSPTPDKLAPEGREFFETKIRPVLAKNCYACHGDSKTSLGGLTLDTRAGVLRGGNSGPAVIPGKVEESNLIRAIRHDGRKMPPTGKLPDAVIADFEKWVAMGAPDPRDGKVTEWKESGIDIEKGRKYWAFQTPIKPSSPKVRNAGWSSQPIDRLLLAKLESKRLTPAPDADRATYIRRITLDLTGLPPTPEEVDAFVKDRRPNAYSRLVDRLLASDRFGERWGRHWLDVARYAESVGRGRNYAMPLSWRYRDYVIDSFNQDKPYDQFIREQIAGDLLPASSQAQRNQQTIATGFLALGSHDLIELNAAIFQMDVVDEMVHTTTKAFLGLTVGCARCHDHKFDPIPTKDYYAMAGIFRSTEILSGLQRRPRDNASYFNINLLAKLDINAAESKQDFFDDPQRAQAWNTLVEQLEEAREGFLPGQNQKKQRRPQAQIRQNVTQILLQMDKYPLPKDLAMGAREGKIADCEIHIRGDVKTLGDAVPRGFVQVLGKAGETGFEIGPKDSGRLQLANWLARRENPLTARVMANRVWHHLFGKGIVATVDNFGKMGEAPLNQALLDYLAVRFMDQGWSVKKLVREIALSRAYRMSTAHNVKNSNIDPYNDYLWRMNRRRLEVEAIRDSMMLISGKLELSRPEASPVLYFKRGFDVGRGQGTIPDDYAVKMAYRSVYVPVIRNFLPSMFETFDFPEPSEMKGRREITTIPTQALFLVNSTFVMDLSKSASERLLSGSDASGRQRVERVYREVLSRAATEAEIEQSLSFIDAMRSNTSGDNDEKSAWARLYQALFASAEFRYRS